MNIVHEIARRRMPLLTDGLPGRLEAHIASCLSCQHEASRYRMLQRILATYAHERFEVPHDLEPGVMAALDRPDEGTHRRFRAGPAAAVAGAVAAGAVVLARLARRRAA